MADYNIWYIASYEPLFRMSNWKSFSADVEKKIVCIFSWMPHAIMNVSHSGRGENRKTKAMVYSPDEVKKQVKKLKPIADYFKGKKLADSNLDDPLMKENIYELYRPLLQMLGGVTASKYLHFSYPHFFIMWDRSLRINNGFPDSPGGYYEYLKKAQSALRDEETLNAAKKEYPANPIRGLDLLWIKEL